MTSGWVQTERRTFRNSSPAWERSPRQREVCAVFKCIASRKVSGRDFVWAFMTAAYEARTPGGMEYIPTRFLRTQARKKLTRKNAERSHLWREAHHHVELCGEFADARASYRCERHDHRVFCL